MRNQAWALASCNARFTRATRCADTKRLLATLNAGDDDVIRSLFVNDAAAAILTVAVSASDQFHSLRCNSVPLAAVREGQAACTQAMHTLFSDSDEPLTWPGFLELDEANGICLAFFAQSKTFRVLDLATYTPLHAFRHAHIREVKLSLGLLLLVHERQPTHQPLQLMCWCGLFASGLQAAGLTRGARSKKGAILACHDEPLLSDAKIDLIDQCGGHILIKQGATLALGPCPHACSDWPRVRLQRVRRCKSWMCAPVRGGRWRRLQRRTRAFSCTRRAIFWRYTTTLLALVAPCSSSPAAASW